MKKKLYNSLSIKDFIIVGNKEFHKKIKLIEKDIKSKSIKYLNIDEMLNYIKEKNDNDKKKENGKNILSYFYFLIIEFKEYKSNLEKILLLSAETGVSFIFFLYINDENSNSLISKEFTKFYMSLIYVYSPQDILYYLFQKNYIYIPKEINEESCAFYGINIPKITFEQNDDEKYKGGCFELAETLDTNLKKKNLL